MLICYIIDRMKKISFIPLLLISPLLFMGAVYPYARETPYEDYEISDLTFGEKDNGAYPYSLSISNTGEGYISLTDFRFDDGEYGNGYIEQIGDFFDSYLYLAPGGKCSLSGHSQVNMDPEKINYNCVAFCEYSINEYKSVTFTGMDEEDYYNGTSYNYYFNIEGYPQENDYYLTYLLEFTYDGVTYAKRFFGETFDLELTKEIDPAEDIEFSSLSSFKVEIEEKTTRIACGP